MRTRYCIRRELGICLKEGGRGGKLYLENNGNRFALDFDCTHCMMSVTYAGRYKEARTGESATGKPRREDLRPNKTKQDRHRHKTARRR